MARVQSQNIYARVQSTEPNIYEYSREGDIVARVGREPNRFGVISGSRVFLLLPLFSVHSNHPVIFQFGVPASHYTVILGHVSCSTQPFPLAAARLYPPLVVASLRAPGASRDFSLHFSPNSVRRGKKKSSIRAFDSTKCNVQRHAIEKKNVPNYCPTC